MGLFACQHDDARYRVGARGRHDQRKAPPCLCGSQGLFGLILGLISALIWSAAPADILRIASFNAELERDGPGLLLRDIVKRDPQVQAVIRVLTRADADIVVLQGIDFDRGHAALTALRDEIAVAGKNYPHLFALRPNNGWQTGIDLDGDGRIGGPRDAQGYGRFAGQGGMAILSRFPIDQQGVVDLSDLLWSDLGRAEGPSVPGVLGGEVTKVQRLSSTGHWVVPFDLPAGRKITFLVFHATPPVFDGPEDRNGYRNADELRLWLAYLDGELGNPVSARFVIAGDANNDPRRGDGHKGPLRDLLSDPRLQDPAPRSAAHQTDTVIWQMTGPMRVDYLLPSSDLMVRDAGVLWPAPNDPFLTVVKTASRHRLIWVDIVVPE